MASGGGAGQSDKAGCLQGCLGSCDNQSNSVRGDELDQFQKQKGICIRNQEMEKGRSARSKRKVTTFRAEEPVVYSNCSHTWEGFLKK